MKRLRPGDRLINAAVLVVGFVVLVGMWVLSKLMDRKEVKP